MTPADLLRRQHKDMRDLVARARALGSFEVRLKARDDLARLVRAHSSIEEEHLYPKIESVDEMADLAETSFHAHEQLKEVLLDLDRCPPGDAELPALLDELEELLIEHATLEERRILPWLASHWSHEQLAALGADMVARFEELLTSGEFPVAVLEPDQLPEA